MQLYGVFVCIILCSLLSVGKHVCMSPKYIFSNIGGNIYTEWVGGGGGGGAVEPDDVSLSCSLHFSFFCFVSLFVEWCFLFLNMQSYDLFCRLFLVSFRFFEKQQYTRLERLLNTPQSYPKRAENRRHPCPPLETPMSYEENLRNDLIHK